MALFSSVFFEDMVAGLTWPCTLPPGWSVEWDASPANDDSIPSNVTYELDRDIVFLSAA